MQQHRLPHKLLQHQSMSVEDSTHGWPKLLHVCIERCDLDKLLDVTLQQLEILMQFMQQVLLLAGETGADCCSKHSPAERHKATDRRVNVLLQVSFEP